MRRAQQCLWISLFMDLLLVLLLAHTTGSGPSVKVLWFLNGAHVLAWQGRGAGRLDAFLLDQAAQGQDQLVLAQFPPAVTACRVLVVPQVSYTREPKQDTAFPVCSHK